MPQCVVAAALDRPPSRDPPRLRPARFERSSARLRAARPLVRSDVGVNLPSVPRSAPLNRDMRPAASLLSADRVDRELRPRRVPLSAGENPGLVLTPRLSREILVPPMGPILRRYRSTSRSRSEFPVWLSLLVERRRLAGVVPRGAVSRLRVLGVTGETVDRDGDRRDADREVNPDEERDEERWLGTVTEDRRVGTLSDERDRDEVRGTVERETDGTLRGAVRRMLLRLGVYEREGVREEGREKDEDGRDTEGRDTRLLPRLTEPRLIDPRLIDPPLDLPDDPRLIEPRLTPPLRPPSDGRPAASRSETATNEAATAIATTRRAGRKRMLWRKLMPSSCDGVAVGSVVPAVP